MSAGSLESESMITHVNELTARLGSRNYPNLALTLSLFEGETHYSVIPATVSRRLKSTLGQAPVD